MLLWAEIDSNGTFHLCSLSDGVLSMCNQHREYRVQDIPDIRVAAVKSLNGGSISDRYQRLSEVLDD